ncbi:polyprenyl synthetase family protein [Bordetella avium]|uniref:Geranyltranstransferase n=1 Tax=Bordetella avium (strain 197N) TaxID=360910 RepID=Q2KZ13_BORA1|nr:farnesyl diphosphate synthase [Bordetella avium]AZY49488.1 polyprenyl synthetase family protein [Bordetella avium]AZY52885.1 polyprenyl synthetase family protein [Bordetella avium]RIQ11735.1 polyprenyl synthetase family protein [Bordetella avium]RIQ16158.1 polyprenyl synthetase family protein [Bordetella avium]RIQ35727.1 polyprenyl synthetase family protein [Bordetella avium]
MKQPPIACADWLHDRALHIEQVLETLMPAADIAPARLHEAMRYAVLGGGKRVRAALVYAAGQACPVNSSLLAIEASMDRAAAAVELIHAYSLVHDDLPCMDDDTLRRGRPTTHVQFDEATAMLAGDALQPLAFELLAGMPIAPALVVQATQVLARAAGSLGMAGGQAIDLHSVGKRLTRDELQTMHSMKTGAMLAASVTLGGVVAGASSAVRQALDAYAQAVGLAFQVVDDILDVTADSASLGKTAGKDAVENKPTYVSLLGLEPARELAEELRLAAHQALGPLGDSGARLAQLADFIVLRDR